MTTTDLEMNINEFVGLDGLTKSSPHRQRYALDVIADGYKKLCAAHAKGHTWRQIAVTLSGDGLKIEPRSLKEYMYRIRKVEKIVGDIESAETFREAEKAHNTNIRKRGSKSSKPKSTGRIQATRNAPDSQRIPARPLVGQGKGAGGSKGVNPENPLDFSMDDL
ncbi:hypothetical protein [Roseibium aggregatum]|jgi:hypothetical protein|uniref:Uncharacterized protein n=1 Tax=Roseibium aggregatum TaxID=187304 RepID=A0A0M6YAY8_9HYPH|nr:hypothetical protein [Roseibium aggregatum]CTQ47242.1 hypothetical protein LAL4801_05704 [Roseibium aggregatum]